MLKKRILSIVLALTMLMVPGAYAAQPAKDDMRGVWVASVHNIDCPSEQGMTADQLSEMIRESLRDELRQLHPEPSAETPNYLTRRETARRLRISLVTLNDWVNRGRIRAHKIGGRVLFRDSDVEAALHRIVPIKSR